MVKLNNYDIIFMDLYISDINGTTLVKLLRKQCYNNKIIGMSSDINYDLSTGNTISPRNSFNGSNFENHKILRLYDEIIIKPLNENDILDNLKY
jgi:CheY-like chemotaxis protein